MKSLLPLKVIISSSDRAKVGSALTTAMFVLGVHTVKNKTMAGETPLFLGGKQNENKGRF
jgi:hypothetical protein